MEKCDPCLKSAWSKFDIMKSQLVFSMICNWTTSRQSFDSFSIIVRISYQSSRLFLYDQAVKLNYGHTEKTTILIIGTQNCNLSLSGHCNLRIFPHIFHSDRLKQLLHCTNKFIPRRTLNPTAHKLECNMNERLKSGIDQFWAAGPTSKLEITSQLGDFETFWFLTTQVMKMQILSQPWVFYT